MKTVFDKPNEQCPARLDIAVARKRGLKAKLFLLGAMVCALGMMTACKMTAAKEDTPKGFLSISDFSSDDIIVLGTYDELVSKMGEPLYCSDSAVLAKINDSTLLSIPGLYYDGVSYILKGDSVQLFFLDLRKSVVSLTLQTCDGHPLTIDSNTLIISV